MDTPLNQGNKAGHEKGRTPKSAAVNTQGNNTTKTAAYDVPPDYCGAWNPTPANELEHCKEAAQRYRRNLQFWLSRFRKIHILIDHHQHSISRLRAESLRAKRNASEYMRLQDQAEKRLSSLQGVQHG